MHYFLILIIQFPGAAPSISHIESITAGLCEVTAPQYIAHAKGVVQKIDARATVTGECHEVEGM